jgi:hypothetical protein
MKIKHLLPLLLLCFASSAFSELKLLCISEDTTGFRWRYPSKKWQTDTFEAENDSLRWVITIDDPRSTESKGAFKRFGKKSGRSEPCRVFVIGDLESQIVCTENQSKAILSIKIRDRTYKFLYSDYRDFWDRWLELQGDVIYSLGYCQPIE